MDANVGLVLLQAATNAQSVVYPPGGGGAPPISGGLLLTLVLVCAVLIYGILRGGEALLVLIKRRGKACIIWLEPDGMGWKMEWKKRIGNEIEHQLDGKKGRPKLDGKSRWNGKWPMWLVHQRWGVNYVAETDEAVNENEARRELRESNPFSYFHAIMHNESQDALEANKDKDSWIPMAIIAGLVLSVLMFGMLGFLIYKVGGAISGAAAANAAHQAALSGQPVYPPGGA